MQHPVKHIETGSLEVARIGLGATPMSDTLYTGAGENEPESIRTLHRALEMGVNFIDTAEVYGMYTARGARRPRPQGPPRTGGAGDEVRLHLLLGRGEGVLDSSPQSIRVAVEGSLKRLSTATSTCITSTGSTRPHPSRTPWAPWPS
jgi:aryl-alcohol dehydrogenase-like predicted oxidoreductase